MQKIRNITAMFLLAFFALLQADNANAKVTFERDQLGRVLKEISNGVEVASTYNMQGQREKIISTLGADITAAYNPLGDLLTLSSGEWSTQYRRDLFGLETDRNLGNGISVSTERDRLGRVTDRKTKQGFLYLDQKEYFWSTNNKLSSIVDNGKHTFFEYDKWGNLAKTTRHEDKQVEYRTPDKMGNLYETEDRSDRRYARGGQLQYTQDWTFKYNDEGFLIEKRHRKYVQQAWLYKWNGAGMLEQVTRPDGVQIRYWYDALGRRIQKRVGTAKTIKYLWDGNVILHEQTNNEPIVTWIFEEGTFKPTGKIVGEENYQIVTNYMGTPDTMYDSTGKEVWSCELNSYGAVRKIYGKKDDCPFRYQGQYEDSDTGLYYNRFRYYSTDTGQYLSQDPIRLYGGTSLYNYVYDTNLFVDVFAFEGSTTVPEGGLISVGGGGGYTIERARKDFKLPKDAPSTTVIKGQQGNIYNTKGRSTIDTAENVKNAGLSGGHYKIEGGTELPKGLAVVADGKDVGGRGTKGHHTIYNTEDMTLEEYVKLQNQIEAKSCPKK